MVTLPPLRLPWNSDLKINFKPEPGYYEDGNFGIRIESLAPFPSFPSPSPQFSQLTRHPTDVIMALEVHTNHHFGEKPYLGFEHVTMVPLCRKLLDESLLTKRERDWINSYHAEIKEKTKSYFEEDERTLKWLERETEELSGTNTSSSLA